MPAFREATWDEALDLIASRLLDIKARHGPRALAGFGSAKCSNEEAYLFQKLMRAALGTNNVDHCTRLCHASSVAALLEGIGSGSVYRRVRPRQARRRDTVDRLEPDREPPGRGDVLQASREAPRGKSDRRRCPPAAHRRPRHALLPASTGTDVAFYNAVMHVLIAEWHHQRRLHPQPHRELRRAEGHRRKLPPRARGPRLRHPGRHHPCRCQAHRHARRT